MGGFLKFIPLIVRGISQVAAGFLLAKGASPEDTETIIGGAVTGITLLWSFLSKKKDEQKKAVAQASPIKMTEKQIEHVLDSGAIVPVTTPKDEVPKIINK